MTSVSPERRTSSSRPVARPGDELMRGTAEDATAGLSHHWIVDPRAETLTTCTALDGVFAPTAVHGRDAVVDLDVGAATVRVDVGALLGRGQSPEIEKCW